MIIRPATDADLSQMCDILNALIIDGSTTAIEGEITSQDLGNRMHSKPDQASWCVAEDEDSGLILGFQWAEAMDRLPPDAASIATFARIGHAGRGVGSALFAKTCSTCRGMSFARICASIRSDNDSGLRFYDKIGFVTYETNPLATMNNGQVTGKTYKRFDL